MFKNFATTIQTYLPYLGSLAFCGIAIAGMITGKLDWNTGMGIIAGSTLLSGAHRANVVTLQQAIAAPPPVETPALPLETPALPLETPVEGAH